MMPIDHRTVKKGYVVLCEGKDTELFLISYLNSRALREDARFGRDVQTFSFEGVSKLAISLMNLKNTEGYERVRSILVLRDAEASVEKAQAEVAHAFEKAALPVPRHCGQWYRDDGLSVAYVLMPTCDTEPAPGALEDLCWEILAGEDVESQKQDVRHFVSEFKSNYEGRIVSHEHKSRLHAYLSVHDNLVSLKIGEAAKAGAFDWDSEKLSPLREVIRAGFEKE